MCLKCNIDVYTMPCLYSQNKKLQFKTYYGLYSAKYQIIMIFGSQKLFGHLAILRLFARCMAVTGSNCVERSTSELTSVAYAGFFSRGGGGVILHACHDRRRARPEKGR